MREAAVERIKKVTRRLTTWVEVQFRGNPVQANWWSGHLNFGDLLTPALLRQYGATPVYAAPFKADLVSTGSILQQLPTSFSGTILGSGVIEDKPLSLPDAEFMAVRGALTRERVGAPPNTPLGDPGLLANHLLKSPPNKAYTLGIVPHYVHAQDRKLLALIERWGNSVKLIDVQQKPQNVVRDIAQCTVIASSSLHGIITAHSLRVPALWLQVSGGLKGGTFKFEDYASSLTMKLPKLDLASQPTFKQLMEAASTPEPGRLADIQGQLDELFYQYVCMTSESVDPARHSSAP